MSFQDIGRKRNANTSLSSSIPSASASASASVPSPYRTKHQQPNQNQYNNQSPTSKFRKGGTSSGYTYTGGINIGVGANNGMSSLIEGGGVGVGGGDNEYSGISQAILQYQQNVGILSNIVQSIGTTRTPQDTQVLTQQYNLQTDVIQQLSSKIQLQLEQMEKQKQTNHNNTSTSASTSTSTNTSTSNQQQHRATHLKLTRDYKWVETKYKNLQLEARKKWNMLEMQRRRVVEEEQRKNLENDLDHDSEQLQMQLRDDRIVEEIMREREEEVRNINKGMHQVNEIYKDLADLVSFQQDQVDEVEITMEQANKNAESGLKQIEKAHAKSNESNCVIS